MFLHLATPSAWILNPMLCKVRMWVQSNNHNRVNCLQYTFLSVFIGGGSKPHKIFMWKILYFRRYCSRSWQVSRTEKKRIYTFGKLPSSHFGKYMIFIVKHTHFTYICLIMYAVSIYYSIQIAAKLSFSPFIVCHEPRHSCIVPFWTVSFVDGCGY